MSHIPDDVIKDIIARQGKNTYVVLYKPDGEHLDLFPDIALQRPWSSKLKLHAEQVAKECDGMACTWKDAWDMLTKAYPQFEKNIGDFLIKRIEKLNEKRTNAQPIHKNRLLDQHGRPL